MGRRTRVKATPMQIAVCQRPQSSATRVVFPYDWAIKSYTKTDFNPIITQGRVSEQEVD